jgi:hypothetical protein
MICERLIVIGLNRATLLSARVFTSAIRIYRDLAEHPIPPFLRVGVMAKHLLIKFLWIDPPLSPGIVEPHLNGVGIALLGVQTDDQCR